MPEVSARVAELLGDRLRGKEYSLVRPGEEALLALLEELRRQVVAELQTAEGGRYTAYHLQRHLASIEGHLGSFRAQAGRSLSGSLDRAWQAGGALLSEAAEVSGLYTGYGHVSSALLEALKEASVHRIDSLSEAAFDKLRGELVLGLLGEKTLYEVTQAIAGSLAGAGPGIWESLTDRAQMIVRTELGRAYSAATQKSLEAAVPNVPDLEKQWWHAGHPKRARLWHLNLNGQHVPVNEPFRIGATVALMYPRDPKAPLSETIRCGCEVVPWHPSWGKQELPKSGKRRFT